MSSASCCKWIFIRRCGVKDLSLQINSLGDRDSKQRYRDALVTFLTPKAAQLSEDSQPA